MNLRQAFLDQLTAYHPATPDQVDAHARFLRLFRDAPDPFDRTQLPGHVTASAVITDPQRTHILLIHHAKLRRWLQPGGHIEIPTDHSVPAAARREAEEETGLQNLTPIAHDIFDLDIHEIPPRGDMPVHLHYDVRYLFQASRHDPLFETAETCGISWFPLTDLEPLGPSITRLGHKLSPFNGSP